MPTPWLLGPYAPVGPPPTAWGEDLVTRYLDSAYFNRFATFDRKRADFALLSALSDVFMMFALNWRNPPDQITPPLFFRSHAAFLAAIELSTGAQVGETYALTRLALEYAGYALLIRRNPTLGSLWEGPRDTRTARRAIAAAFSSGEIRKALLELDGDLESQFHRLYETSIDMGAHPNSLAVETARVVLEVPNETHIFQTYLHRDGPALDRALEATEHAGLCALSIIRHVFPERFVLLGLSDRLQQLSSDFTGLSKARTERWKSGA